LIPSLDGNSRRKAILAILAASNKKAENAKNDKMTLGIMTDKINAPRMDKMFPRTNNRTDALPVYMQVSFK